MLNSMLDEFLCVGICIVSGFLIFFCFQKPVEFHPFNVINIDHTTSEILYEMKLHYNTRKVQRWWRSSIISQKRDDISEENLLLQGEIDYIICNSNKRLYLC